MKRKLLAGLFSAGLALFLMGAAAIEMVDARVIQPRSVSSWGELVKAYYSVRNDVPPLPLPIDAGEVVDLMEKGNWSFLADHWQFKYSGSTYYIADTSKLAKTHKLPLHILVYEDLQRGEVVVLSSQDGVCYKGEALYDAPEYSLFDAGSARTLEEKAEAERVYLFWELSPRRVVWDVMLKAEEDALMDFVLQRDSAVASTCLLEKGATSVRMSVPAEHTNDIWISGESGESGFDLEVYCPSGVTNIELYRCSNLTAAEWVVEKDALLAVNTNRVYWRVSCEKGAGFFVAGNGGMDSDRDLLCDAREHYVTKTGINDSDSDDDSLTDGEEVLIYGLDPNDSDTNHDGVPDAIDANMQGISGEDGVLVLLPGSEYRYVRESTLQMNSYGAYGE